MLIPLIKEESLRRSEVVAYDPFILASRMIMGPSFLYGATYSLGDEVFDGTYYHEVVANSPNTTYVSDTTTPTWSTQKGGFTTSGTVKFENIGTSSRKYGRTDEVLMRIGHGSFAFVQVAFPQTVTPAVDAIRLVLTAPIFQMGSSSDVFLAPVVVFEPTLITADVYASGSIRASGVTFSDGTRGVEPMRYASDVEFLASGDLIADGELMVTVNGQLEDKPLTTEFFSISYADSVMSASLSKIRSAVAELSNRSGLDTESLVIGLVNPNYEPLNFEELTYPTAWPPDYLDTTTLRSVGVPRFGEQVSVDLSGIIQPNREVYTLVIFRMSDSVLVDGQLKDTARSPILIGGDESAIRPYAQPRRNRRSLQQALGGPYLGYILDTYETDTGVTHPIPWFDSTEAKRIAQRMTETNFFAAEPGLEVKVEYNSSSQEFVVTQTDFRIIEGIAQNGIKTELQRISPVRIGSRLLYPIGTYDVPWLLVSTDYNPNPIIRLKGALPMTLGSSATLVDAVFTQSQP